jgi:AcrR family transcriptional regulator
MFRSYRRGVSVSGRRGHHHRLGSRRTQEQRRSETQSRLLDATADALADLGWAGLSTTEVSRRAGVSRGAQQHHYPQMVLVAAALEHLLNKLRDEYHEAYAALPNESTVMNTPRTATTDLADEVRPACWPGSECGPIAARGARKRREA